MTDTTRSNWEIIPSERGKEWTNPRSYTVTGRTEKGERKSFTVPVGYKYDRYTIYRDLPDDKPSMVHDFACDAYGSRHVWDDGTNMTRQECDWLLLDQMLASEDEETRNNAEFYYKSVRKVSWIVWARAEVLLFIWRVGGWFS